MCQPCCLHYPIQFPPQPARSPMACMLSDTPSGAGRLGFRSLHHFICMGSWASYWTSVPQFPPCNKGKIIAPAIPLNCYED